MKNVVVFFTDQQRHDTCGAHGNPLDLTPNFDALARRGTHLYNCFTPQPVCGPARACLQTGLYATQNGCWRNGITLAPEHRTLAQAFNDGGYHTSYIGKWHLGAPNAIGPVAPEQRGGYQEWLAANTLEHTSDAYQTTLYNNDGQAVHLPGYRVDAMTDAAIRYLDRRKDEAQPFFLFISFLEPHHQNHRDDYPAPAGYRERYAGKWTPPDLQALGGTSAQHLPGYYGMVKRLDEALGRVTDALKSLGLEDNTIVVQTSDHACHFKTRNGEYKRSCHEASIRVPCAIAGPGFEGGGQKRELVSLLDLPPTLLEACDLPVPPAMQGRSCVPLLNGAVDWPSEVFVQISESQVGRAVRTQRWKYSVSAPDKNGNQDSNSERYVEEWLYDLQADPDELHNLIGLQSHREVADVMKARLLRRMMEAGESEPEIENAPSRPGGQRLVSTQETQS